MIQTPEVMKSAVTDAANEQLLAAAETKQRLTSLANSLPKMAAPADTAELRNQPLVSATTTLRQNGRTPEEIAAFTLERGYPRA